MKSKLCIGLALMILFLSLSGFTFTAEIEELDLQQNAIIEVATTYLEESAYAQYYYDGRDFGGQTIQTIPTSERDELSAIVNEYVDFRKTQDIVPYTDTTFNNGTLQAFEDNISYIMPEFYTTHT